MNRQLARDGDFVEDRAGGFDGLEHRMFEIVEFQLGGDADVAAAVVGGGFGGYWVDSVLLGNYFLAA